MKRLLFVVIVLLTFVAAPALFACEKCISPGSRDPNGGGPYGTAICWTLNSGSWSWCSGGPSNCTGSDPENVCPVPGSGGCDSDDPDCPLNKDSIDVSPAFKKCAVDLSGRCATKTSSRPGSVTTGPFAPASCANLRGAPLVVDVGEGADVDRPLRRLVRADGERVTFIWTQRDGRIARRDLPREVGGRAFAIDVRRLVCASAHLFSKDSAGSSQ